MNNKVVKFLFLFTFTLGLVKLVGAQKVESFKKTTKPYFIEFSSVGGPSLLAEKAPIDLGPAFTDYFNKMRSGWNLGAGIEFFINPYLGIGASYSKFSSKIAADSLVIEILSSKFAFDISNKVTIHTISPQIIGRLPFYSSGILTQASIGPAWLFYRDLGKTVSDSAMFKGSSPGLKVGLGANYSITDNFGLSLQASYVNAFLRKLTKVDGEASEVIELEKDNYQNISRYDISIGIFYTLRFKN